MESKKTNENQYNNMNIYEIKKPNQRTHQQNIHEHNWTKWQLIKTSVQSVEDL